MICCDLPYGTTACKWDEIIPFDELWKCYKRIIKDNGAIILFASQPFTSKLVMSNIKNFKYEWIWQKAVGSNFATLKYQPMKEHEEVLVFSYGTHQYYPIMQERAESGKKRLGYGFIETQTGEANGGLKSLSVDNKYYDKNLRNPSSVQYFNNREKDRGLHPTQKPIALLEYLIKTYTKEGMIVLDNCMGSGSCGVACKKLNRDFIGIEKDEKYFNIAKNRIDNIAEIRENTLF